MTARSAGWYPDPANDGSEIYWDGTRWHGRRERLAPPALPDSLNTAQTTKSGGLSDRFNTFWSSLDDTRRVLVILGGIVGATLLLGVGAFVVTELTKSPYEDECKREVAAMYVDEDGAVEACIKAKEAGFR